MVVRPVLLCTPRLFPSKETKPTILHWKGSYETVDERCPSTIRFKPAPETSGKPSQKSRDRHVATTVWHSREEALAILMRILHGKNQHVPKAVNLELLAKIAVLVDYYNCPDAAGLAAEIWIPKLTPPTQVSKDLVFWLLVSWVFGRDEIFRAMIRIAIRESQGPLQTYNLVLGLLISIRICEWDAVVVSSCTLLGGWQMVDVALEVVLVGMEGRGSGP